jgi:adenylate cyclase
MIKIAQRLTEDFAFAYHPDDTDEIRQEKLAILLVAGCCCVAGSVWTAMYLILFGPGVTAALPALFVFIVGASLAISHVTKNHHVAVYAQIICIMYIAMFIQWSIGGILDSGFVMVWAFMGPIIALMFLSPRQAKYWFFAYLFNLVITVLFSDFFAQHGQVVDERTKILFFLMNLGISSIVVYIFAAYFVNAALTERNRANNLLLNILPAPIARRLKLGEYPISDKFESITVLFADIAGFTAWSEFLSPDKTVDVLNGIFSRFDRIVENKGLEKIKTIGDGYMVVAGGRGRVDNHATAIMALAIEMLAEMERFNADRGLSLNIRIGLNTGPAVAGVIGTKKFSYDLWGDTVNTASRMESHGIPGRIQITENTYESLKNNFTFEDRGVIEIKGKGKMHTFLFAP